MGSYDVGGRTGVFLGRLQRQSDHGHHVWLRTDHAAVQELVRQPGPILPEAGSIWMLVATKGVKKECGSQEIALGRPLVKGGLGGMPKRLPVGHAENRVHDRRTLCL